ncbi:MAG: type III-B CRISPR module RAMP protein Cmr1 [Coleofasciculus sp. Co-bin14]|nr:type III-B CRISPR module RAMP protein Cmr1 [Coleofasciculus sp. Co-bin14]
MAGADQATAELRPPAFRGALRYWFRAIAASITTFDKVREWENKVFGNTDAGGAVIIRVQAQKAVSNCVLKRDDNFSGLVYLFFSTYKDNRREARGCFPPGSHFKIILQTRPITQDGTDCLNLAVCTLWMLVNLGGIGSRSNRGGGNLRAKKEPENIGIYGLNFTTQSADINQLSSEINEGFQIVKQLYKKILKGGNHTLTPPTEFDILDLRTASIYLWQSQNAEENDYWDNLLDSFGARYRNFRLRYNNATQEDYKEIKDWLSSSGKKPVTTVKRAAFGLPIIFRFRSLPGKQATVSATGRINRISSPLHIRVVALSNQRCVILISHFKTQLLPNNRQLLLKSKSVTKPLECLAPNQDIIGQEFIPSLGSLIKVIIP